MLRRISKAMLPSPVAHRTAICMDAMLAEVARVQSMLERAKELATVLDLQGEFAAALDAAAMKAARLRKGIDACLEAFRKTRRGLNRVMIRYEKPDTDGRDEDQRDVTRLDKI